MSRAVAAGGAAACLALAACGGGGSGSSAATTDTKRITGVIETAVTTTDPSICTRLLTEELVGRLGGIAGCRNAVRSNTAASVDVRNIRVTRGGTHAVTVVVPHGGAEDGKRYSDTLVAHGGRWRISAIRTPGP
jgi:hypothetical protein